MRSEIVAPLKVELDATSAINQLNGLMSLIKLEPSPFESIPEHVLDLFFSCISGLTNNIILDDFATTIVTENINKIVLKVEVIGPTDLITSAIRTGDIQGLSIAHNEIYS
ncbi:hypothetical protein [Tatumella sp. UCD-D_suzukii]|uniref:hypothetical protein n=1 Tax=Tatumella sp. UCD-D_suzukii TaxID=1408192 RepID=UPI00046F59A1|nr:hypothetical protein [Tatumella sp. UCD-D_suzukii]